VSEPLPPPLPPRLAAIVAAIEPGSRVADIGSDHGRLPLWLVRSGRAVFCLATEKDEARLERVARPPARAAWAERLAYRAGDGLAAVHPRDAVDSIVIAGMGGSTILRILAGSAAGLLAPRRLVLQPRTDGALLRRWLSSHGWRLESERLIEENGRFHLTIAAERGDDASVYRHPMLDRGDLLAAGPLLVRSRSDILARFWRAQRDRLETILLNGATGNGRARTRTHLARAERVLAAISRRGG